jgi:hypothetical protein
MPVNGGNPQCDFSTYRQCRATVRGTGGDCLRNPGRADGWMPDNGGYAYGFDHPGWHGWDYGWNDRSW